MKKITLNKKIKNDEYESYFITKTGQGNVAVKLNIKIEDDGDVENEVFFIKLTDIIAMNNDVIIIESRCGQREFTSVNSEFKETPLDADEKNRIANEWLNA